MRKRSVLLVSAFSATLAFHSFAQPAPEAKPVEPKPAEPKPVPPAAAPAPAPAAPAPAAAPVAPAPAAPAPAAADAQPPAAEGTEAEGATAEPEGSLPQAQPGLTPLPTWPEPADDGAALKRQGAERPSAPKPAAGTGVFAEDWWTHTRPILEWHGSFRARGELFYKFHLGRRDAPANALFPRPVTHGYRSIGDNAYGPSLCTPEEVGSGEESGFDKANRSCDDNTNAGANLRFRLAPEFHVSDNLRVLTQIDLLDNLVLGSTPSGYSTSNGEAGNSVNERSGYAPLGIFDDDAAAPSGGRNSLRDSILVKRVWAEWVTPVGQLRFGRMPNHWGLGMVWNAGDGHDDDYQSTIDRAQIISGIKSLDLYVSAAIDFPNEGPTTDNISLERGQPYDIGQLDDVNQYTFSIARKKSPELLKAALNDGDIVINGGLQLQYRHQLLAADATGPCMDEPAPGAAALGCTLDSDLGFVRRGASIWTPDAWLQLLYRGFRFETEVATVQGTIDNVSTLTGAPAETARDIKLRSWGFAAELEQLLAENKLQLGFKFGWASGDSDVESLSPGSGFQSQNGDDTVSTFRFHPSYGLDLILYRNVLSRVQGTYYFRPSVKYDFLRDPNGQKIGGGLAAVWSRASEFMQSPGHDRDLGVEVNGQIYFQSKDGSLNDEPGRMGGFFAKLEYAVLFPMAGLGYTSRESAQLIDLANDEEAADTNLAQALRLYLGVGF